MVNKLINQLMKFNFKRSARVVLSIMSIILGKHSKFRFVKNRYWVQEQAGRHFVDLSPNYRFKISEVDELCSDIYFYKYKPKEGDICIDIGAGIGTEALITSELINSRGRLLAVEANTKTFEALELLKEFNRLENMEVFRYAISDTNDSVKITTQTEHHIENKIISIDDMEEDSKETFDIVDARTMDQFLLENQVPYIDYLKVNIEGAEKMLIKSFDQIKNVKNIAISCHDFLSIRTGDNSFSTKSDVTDFLKSHEFEIECQNTGVDYIDDWVYGINKKTNIRT